MVRKIVLSSDPVLRIKSKPVAKIDKKIKELIRDLKDTLRVQKDPEGVGLAAPQIGKNLRIFVAKYENFERVVINPEIIKIENNSKDGSKKSKKKEILEGCLSLPYYYGPLKRAPRITIKYIDEKGSPQTETFSGFHAQIIMHEIDHLEGVLFIDHLISEGKPLYKIDGDEWEEVELA